ncbi:CoA-dependent acyltransferase [Dendrothele bispora CBS 962.96]|uniref:CoA-dependent acyltransferase n=1 Tax=Dendrothele bispora (strain CBS 962.96) TaxID=1314807 RepID=A0A4S8MVI8_DENBC|nr:CoA-dependent acyltransferase [Dendrothele bispora CBS 962.96]
MFLARTRTRAVSNRRPSACLLMHANKQKYLASLEPLLQEESLRTGVPYEQAYALREKWADQFGNGIGKVCQERLKALDRASPNNWLDDNFWLKTYLEWRVPLLINSNWWLAFSDEEGHGGTSSASGFTNWQLRRAAWLTHRTLELKNKIDSLLQSGSLSRYHPNWSLVSRERIQNVQYLPNPSQSLRFVVSIVSARSPLSQLVVVIAKNWFYALRVYERNAVSGQPELVAASQILERMAAIAHDASTRPGEAPMIGVLSADNRDTWAQCNAETSHTCSRSPLKTTTFTKALSGLYSVFRLTLKHMLSTKNPKLDPSGQAGAMVPSMVGEHIIGQSVPEDFGRNTFDVEFNSGSSGDGWHRLDWITDSYIHSACVEAKERADRIISNSDDSVLWFEGFGCEWIKSLGLSSDAFVQLALQLAWFRTHPKESRFTATYETVLTRMFHKGRTETIRTLSTDSRRWVLVMDDPSVTADSKSALLLRALQTHTALTREAMTGRGIDRHLLGYETCLHRKSLYLLPNTLALNCSPTLSMVKVKSGF